MISGADNKIKRFYDITHRPLIDALDTEGTSLLEEKLKEGFDVNLLFIHYVYENNTSEILLSVSLLGYIALFKNVEFLKALINHSLNINQAIQFKENSNRSILFHTFLTIAIKLDILTPEFLQYLNQKGLDINQNFIFQKDPDGHELHTTALQYAIQHNPKLVKCLIDAGAKTNEATLIEKSNSGNTYYATPLHISVHFNQPDTLKLLITHGAETNLAYLNQKNIDGLSIYHPIISLALTHRPMLCNDLVENGADINKSYLVHITPNGPKEYRTPLIQYLLTKATNEISFNFNYLLDNLKLFIKAGANINQNSPIKKNADGNNFYLTPLLLTITEIPSLTKLIIAAGADVNQSSFTHINGKTEEQNFASPLMIALINNKQDQAELLLASKANINQVVCTHESLDGIKHYGTLLSVALGQVEEENEYVSKLMKTKFDINQLTLCLSDASGHKSYHTPLGIAKRLNKQKWGAKLLDAGAFWDFNKCQNNTTNDTNYQNMCKTAEKNPMAIINLAKSNPEFKLPNSVLTSFKEIIHFALLIYFPLDDEKNNTNPLLSLPRELVSEILKCILITGWQSVDIKSYPGWNKDTNLSKMANDFISDLIKFVNTKKENKLGKNSIFQPVDEINNATSNNSSEIPTARRG